ncbi:MAG: DNA primase [Gemmatimonadota bacterium]
MIADETVERVRAAADIVAIIQESGVPLKRYGGDWRGACPFHGGKNPNFAVSPKLGSFHCFVCHEKGDVFTYVRKRQGLDFSAAVKLVGERSGIEVIDAPRRAVVADPNEPNWEVLSSAAEWFRTQLAGPLGASAREYLTSRNIDEAARERFGIGFAPRDAALLRRYLHSLGFDDTRLTEAGLLVVREGDSEPSTRFRGRVMFPILDEFGHHVGFGGRALGDHKPKYLNSPQSDVFQKRRTLYGMHTARQAMRKNSRAIVVEGYLDAIRLALAGLEEVVAPLGTALTEEQAALLVRYANEIFLIYDSDEAGQQATYKSGMELLRHKAAVRIVSLPDGEDPDTFVSRHGRAALETQLSQAIDLFDRQVQILERRGYFADLRKRRRAVDRLLPTIRAARDPLTRDLYLARLAEVSQLDKATLAAEADEISQRGRRSASAPASEPPPDDAPPVGVAPYERTGGRDRFRERDDDTPPSPYAALKKRDSWKGKRGRNQGPDWQATAVPPRPRPDEPVERALVRAMMIDRGLAERIAERHGPDVFRDPAYRALFSALLGAGHDDDLDVIAERLDPETLERLRELTEGFDPSEMVASDIALNLAKLDARALREQCDAIRREMNTADPERNKVLLSELVSLERELRLLQPMRSPRGKPRT